MSCLKMNANHGVTFWQWRQMIASRQSYWRILYTSITFMSGSNYGIPNGRTCLNVQKFVLNALFKTIHSENGKSLKYLMLNWDIIYERNWLWLIFFFYVYYFDYLKYLAENKLHAELSRDLAFHIGMIDVTSHKRHNNENKSLEKLAKHRRANLFYALNGFIVAIMNIL